MTPAHRILACPPTFFRPTLSPSSLNCSSVKSISNLHRKPSMLSAKGKSLSAAWLVLGRERQEESR